MANFTWIESVKLIPLYLLFIGTFGLASLEKFRSGGVPVWFKLQFEPTFLNAMPGGLGVQYYCIAILEASVVILFLLSAGSLEFLPGHGVGFLKAGLILALFTFFALGFGLRAAADYNGAANLFMYFAATFLFFMYVEHYLNWPT